MALPEGYIAPNEDSFVHAVRSSALKEHGEVHLSGDYNSSVGVAAGINDTPLDSHVELSIKNDPRLEALKLEAREIGQRFGDEHSEHYIADRQSREKAITDAINDKVHATYGDYSSETVEDRGNEEEKAQKGFFSTGTAQLANMEKDSLTCRHYAAVASVLLDEAGVANHMVCSQVTQTSKKDGQYALDPNHAGGSHAYVVTEGGAVVDATFNPKKTKTAYLPIENDVTAEDIVLKGKVAITDKFAFGGHKGNGELTDKEDLLALQHSALDTFAAKPHTKEPVKTLGDENVPSLAKIEDIQPSSAVTNVSFNPKEFGKSIDAARDRDDADHRAMLDAFRQDRMARYDANHDGTLDKQEITAKYDKDKDGKLNSQEAGANKAELFDKELDEFKEKWKNDRAGIERDNKEYKQKVVAGFDKDHDGKINSQESADFTKAVDGKESLRKALGGNAAALAAIGEIGQKLKGAGVSGASIEDITSLGSAQQNTSLPKEQSASQSQGEGR